MEFQQLSEGLEQATWLLFELAWIVSIATAVSGLVAGLSLAYCLSYKKTAGPRLGN